MGYDWSQSVGQCVPSVGGTESDDNDNEIVIVKRRGRNGKVWRGRKGNGAWRGRVPFGRSDDDDNTEEVEIVREK